MKTIIYCFLIISFGLNIIISASPNCTYVLQESNQSLSPMTQLVQDDYDDYDNLHGIFKPTFIEEIFTFPIFSLIVRGLIFIISTIKFIKEKPNFKEYLMKFGFYDLKEFNINSNEKHIVLIGLGIGETLILKPIIDKLRRQYKHSRISIGVINRTGYDQVMRFKEDKDNVFFLPFDFSEFNFRMIQSLKPDMIVFSEFIMNPNLLELANDKKISTILVNASFNYIRNHKWIRNQSFIMRFHSFLMNKISLFHLQSQKDIKFLREIGVSSELLDKTSNLKSNSAKLLIEEKEIGNLKNALGFGQKDPILVAGSVHSKEEPIIIDIYKKLKLKHPNLKLIIAPRHPPLRSKKIIEYAQENDLSSIQLLSNHTGKPSDIVVVDTRGDLHFLYSLASIAFIGGSLIKRGGHNFFEAANFEVPIIMGPYYYNFADSVNDFLDNEAMVIVENGEDLFHNINLILENPFILKKLGIQSKQTMLSMQNSLDFLLEHLSLALSNSNNLLKVAA